MRAINTMTQDEYATLLSDAMRRMDKKICRLMDREESLMMEADNKMDEEKALKHHFNAQALQFAMYSITLSPNEIIKILNKEKGRLENLENILKKYCTIQNNVLSLSRNKKQTTIKT